jgi:ribulose-5-phosphate 4-epimerase/fuculose-1-phosphate aldolase
MNSPSATLGRTDNAERSTRVDLAAAFRLAHHYGYDEMIWNHITARVPGAEECFLINRHGLRFDEVSASNLVKVDVDGNVIDSPHGVPIAGFVIHSAIHRARPDVKCVMHTHTHAGLAVSTLEDGLLPLVSEGMYHYGDIAYHPYEGVSTELEERERMAANLGGKSCMILRNHGLLTVGTSVAEAFVRMYWLDLACNIQLKVLSTGAKFRTIPEDVCRHAARQHQEDPNFAAGVQEWPALLRLLDQKDPSYLQ